MATDVSWTNAGLLDMLAVYFQNITAPSAFAMRLVNATGTNTQNWADISANELPSANGYNAGGVAINRDGTASGWPTLALDGGEPQIIGKTCSWTAFGNWATAITLIAFVAVKAVDQLLAYKNITAVQPQTGDTVGWTPKLKLTKVVS